MRYSVDEGRFLEITPNVVYTCLRNWSAEVPETAKWVINKILKVKSVFRKVKKAAKAALIVKASEIAETRLSCIVIVWKPNQGFHLNCVSQRHRIQLEKVKRNPEPKEFFLRKKYSNKEWSSKNLVYKQKKVQLWNSWVFTTSKNHIHRLF